MNTKKIKEKKPSQLKLASMSANWKGNAPSPTGKHRSQMIQKMKKSKQKGHN